MAPKHEKEAAAARERSLEVEKPDEPENQETTEESPLKMVKRRFVRRAKALQPMILDFLNVQTGIAASVIMDLVESKPALTQKKKKKTWRKPAVPLA